METAQVTMAVARRTGLEPAVVACVLHGLQSVVTEQLVHGCPVRLTGFVSFSRPTAAPRRRARDRHERAAGRVHVRPGDQLRRAVEGA